MRQISDGALLSLLLQRPSLFAQPSTVAVQQQQQQATFTAPLSFAPQTHADTSAAGGCCCFAHSQLLLAVVLGGGANSTLLYSTAQGPLLGCSEAV